MDSFVSQGKGGRGWKSLGPCSRLRLPQTWGLCKMPPKKWENLFPFSQEKKMHVAPNDDDAAILAIVERPNFRDVCQRKRMTLQEGDNVGVSRLLFNPDQIWSCRVKSDQENPHLGQQQQRVGVFQLAIIGRQLGLSARLLGDNGLSIRGLPIVLKVLLSRVQNLLHLCHATNHFVVSRFGLVGVLT